MVVRHLTKADLDLELDELESAARMVADEVEMKKASQDKIVQGVVVSRDDSDDDATTPGNSTASSASASASSTATTELIDKTDVYSRHSVTTASTATTVAKSKARRKHRIRPLVVSILEISTVMPDDAGTYTCAPSNARNHSVVVHVIQGTVACQRLNTKCI